MNEEFEKMRAEFEAWLVPSWSRETYTDEDGDLQYREDWVQGAWIGWQASRKQALEEAVEAAANAICECCFSEKEVVIAEEVIDAIRSLQKE